MNPLNWILLGVAAGVAGALAAREVQRAREGAPPPLPAFGGTSPGQAPPPAGGGTSPGQAPPTPDRGPILQPLAPEIPPTAGQQQPQQPPAGIQPEVPSASQSPRISPNVGDVIDVSKSQPPIQSEEVDGASILATLASYGWTGEIVARRPDPLGPGSIRTIALRSGSGEVPVFWSQGPGGVVKLVRLGRGEAPAPGAVDPPPPSPPIPPDGGIEFTPGPTLVRPGYGSGKVVTDAGVNDILEVSVPESVSDDVNARVIMDQLRFVGWTATVVDAVRQGLRPGHKIIRVVLRAGAGDIPVDWTEDRYVVNLVRGPGPNPGGPIGPGLPEPTTTQGPNE